MLSTCTNTELCISHTRQVLGLEALYNKSCSYVPFEFTGICSVVFSVPLKVCLSFNNFVSDLYIFIISV